MVGTKISALPPADTLDGTEKFELVQAGDNAAATSAQIKNYVLDTPTITGPLTYASVTLAEGTTGLGKMVLDTAPTIASPVLTGTVGGTPTFSGALTFSSALTFSAAIRYGGVTLANAVTGTGNMVLSASPTLTGTLTAAAATYSGSVTSTLGTITANTQAFTATQTWNNAGVTFEMFKLVATDTASGASSLLISAGTAGGGQFFKVDKSGIVDAVNFRMQAVGNISWSGRGLMASDADGSIRLSNNAGTGFTALLFGGTSSSFPAIKRSSAVLQARLADDSAFADFQAENFTANTSFLAGASGGIGWSGRSTLASTSDGNIRLTNNAQTAFTMLQFGGTSSSFPGIKRNSTALNFRLADDSADAAITASMVTSAASVAPPASGATTCGIKWSSTSNLGIYSGTGAPTFSAAKGSLYTQTDATTITTRLYVNTDGSTTWTNFTSAA